MALWPRRSLLGDFQGVYLLAWAAGRLMPTQTPPRTFPCTIVSAGHGHPGHCSLASVLERITLVG